MARILLHLCFVLIVVGCGPRGEIFIDGRVLSQQQDIQPIFVVTNRKKPKKQILGFFNQEFGDIRVPEVGFARMDVSIPPSHQIGAIEWPGHATPDPLRHFVVQEETLFPDTKALMRNMNQLQRSDEVFVFVHGYNVNNAEAVYRLAQVAHDYEARLPVIAFSWPSAGSARGYAYDRDSVAFSRDDLERLLTELSGADKRVHLIAHSLGSHLVMETLRQMSIGGNTAPLRNLKMVALISPDIDEDVFLQQAKRIAPLPQPFVLMVSQKDRALTVAALLTGKPNRLGNISSSERLGDLPISVFDLSNLNGGDSSGHSTAFTSPEAIEMFTGLEQTNAGRN